VGQGLKFRFDVSTFRLLGRELITDRITALFELVKNSYDANADSVTVEFQNVNNISKDTKIIIQDNGIGMTFNDIKNKWMVIGTSSKRESRISPAPYFRRMVGKKGVGRFAVDKLGSTMVLSTKKKAETRKTFIKTDWNVYDKLAKQLDLFDSDDEDAVSKKKFFTDIQNDYWFETVNDESQGTTIEITALREPWTEEDITRAYKELSKLISPVSKLKYPFEIIIKAGEYERYKEAHVKNEAIKYATLDFTLGFDKELKIQEKLVHRNGIIMVEKFPPLTHGPIFMRLFYFDQHAKGNYKKNSIIGEIDGPKVYRDGVIATPFANYEPHPDNKRDVLGIDKRRWSGFWDRLSTRDLLGYIEITDEDNPDVIDSTNRQDFVDNEASRELKKFVIEQIDQIEKYLKYKKDNERLSTISQLKEARNELSYFTEIVKEIKRASPPELEKQLEQLEKHSLKVDSDFKRGIKQYNELEKRSVRQEELFLSFMSLQEYAFEISHVVRTSLSRVSRLADFFDEFFPNPEFNDIFLTYAKDISNEMKKLDGAIEFMLSYAKSTIEFKEFDIKVVIKKVFELHKHLFEAEEIQTDVRISESLKITHNEKFLEDIIENLISNSIKAVKKNVGNKYIKCTGTVEDDQFVILFSDNGYGIAEVDKSRIFNIYFTNTAEEGGAGIGLYIVKTRVESMNGSISVIENEFKPTGATFKIIIPFKH